MTRPVPPRSPGADRRGAHAAWSLFALFALVELATAVTFHKEERLVALLVVDVAIAFAGPVIALIVHFVLPRELRRSFWLTGLICAGVTVLLWGTTCGIAFSGA